jgi:hypothetical protein
MMPMQYDSYPLVGGGGRPSVTLGTDPTTGRRVMTVTSRSGRTAVYPSGMGDAAATASTGLTPNDLSTVAAAADTLQTAAAIGECVSSDGYFISCPSGFTPGMPTNITGSQACANLDMAACASIAGLTSPTGGGISTTAIAVGVGILALILIMGAQR